MTSHLLRQSYSVALHQKILKMVEVKEAARLGKIGCDMYNQRESSLRLFGLPVISSVEQLAAKMRISSGAIYRLSRFRDSYYRVVSVPKKSGGTRTLCCPCRQLKGIQGWILNQILYKLRVSPACMGFIKGSGIKRNAQMHVGSVAMLSLDLEDYFGSISVERVFALFRKIGYSNAVSSLFAKLCTYNNCLPQGSPCSPMLANLISWGMDVRLIAYTARRGIVYTRYADDLTFSSNIPRVLGESKDTIIRIIEDEKFKINCEKSRMAGPARARIATGLVVGMEDVGIGKSKYKILRSKIYNVASAGTEPSEFALNHINGWMAYLKDVDERRYRKMIGYIKKLIVQEDACCLNVLLRSEAEE